MRGISEIYQFVCRKLRCVTFAKVVMIQSDPPLLAPPVGCDGCFAFPRFSKSTWISSSLNGPLLSSLEERLDSFIAGFLLLFYLLGLFSLFPSAALSSSPGHWGRSVCAGIAFFALRPLSCLDQLCFWLHASLSIFMRPGWASLHLAEEHVRGF